MQVSVEFPADQVERFVADVFYHQLPYVEATALNATAKHFQAAQRKRLGDIFTLRRKTWAERSIKIAPFATKTKREVRIAVDSPGNRGDILGKFETDTTKSPLGNSVAVPTEHVPRNAAGVIRSGWRPKKVLARNFKEGFRAFIAPTRKGRRAIWFDERGQGGRMVPLYWLVPRVKIKPELEFQDTAERVINDVWAENFVAAFDRAIKTAR